MPGIFDTKYRWDLHPAIELAKAEIEMCGIAIDHAELIEMLDAADGELRVEAITPGILADASANVEALLHLLAQFQFFYPQCPQGWPATTALMDLLQRYSLVAVL